jgi:predicted oxidoreductase (fatty acid repression mutant protein)
MRKAMIEKIKDLFNEYLDQFMTWYDGLSELYQYGVLFLAFACIGLAIAFYLLSRITRR